MGEFIKVCWLRNLNCQCHCYYRPQTLHKTSLCQEVMYSSVTHFNLIRVTLILLQNLSFSGLPLPDPLHAMYSLCAGVPCIYLKTRGSVADIGPHCRLHRSFYFYYNDILGRLQGILTDSCIYQGKALRLGQHNFDTNVRFGSKVYMSKVDVIIGLLFGMGI